MCAPNFMLETKAFNDNETFAKITKKKLEERKPRKHKERVKILIC